MRRNKILIIDDSNDFRAALKDYLKLQRMNMQVFEASSGEMGVTKASFVRPDIVLMDINLPQVNGFEATRHIKADNPDCQVIILTMFDVQTFKHSAIDVQAADFISKEEVYNRLVPSINKCLQMRK